MEDIFMGEPESEETKARVALELKKIQDERIQREIKTRNRKKCGRCGGTGYVTGYQHVESGRCFACN